MTKYSTRHYSDKQEKAIAKQLHGKQVVNSGATPFRKGDIELEDWLIEAKTSTALVNQYIVKKAWLEKNKEEAFAMGKPYNALAIDFGDVNNQYYMIDGRLFKKLVLLLQSEGEE